MTNNTNIGVKKSAFTTGTTIPSNATLDYVSNGQNFKITFANFLGQAGLSLNLEQLGDPATTPVLDTVGSTNRIRNIGGTNGISVGTDASNGVQVSTNFSFDATGAPLVPDAAAETLAFKSLTAGSGITLSSTSQTIEISGGDLATDQEYFDKSATVAATPEQISTDGRLHNYSVKNNTGAISVVLTPGSSYNFLTTMLEANETISGVSPTFKDKNDLPQATYLDEANNRFIYPSNLYTYNNSYTSFDIRVITTIDHPAIGSNQQTSIILRLRRYIDNSIVSEKEFPLSNKNATNGVSFTTEFLTFVEGETDPYVLDGMYIDILNSSTSSTNFTLVLCDIRKFKY